MPSNIFLFPSFLPYLECSTGLLPAAFLLVKRLGIGAYRSVQQRHQREGAAKTHLVSQVVAPA
jgi:hypothetical protein